jgi:hypothetical protein
MDYSPTWLKEDIDRMLELLAIFEAPDFRAAAWPKLEPRVVEGRVVHPMPYPIYHPAVDRYRSLCWQTTCALDPYAALPEDPEGVETIEVLKTREAMERATLNQIRRYFALCTRAERFCDGYIDGQFETGVFLAALRRVRVLRDAMG